MEVDDASIIIEEYAKYIKSNMVATQQGEAVCISTPMLNRNNDCMNVYVGDSETGGYILSDMGETISDLELSGFKMTAQRIEKMRSILSGYGVRISDGELYVSASSDVLPVRMNMLLQAMASVDDMYMLSQGSVRNLFAEDIGDWMLDHDISYVQGPSFNGRSGLTYKFDYAIGKNKKSKMRLIKAVNNPGRQGIQNALFGWEDVKSSRIDCDGYVFLNASNTKDGKVSDDVLQACVNYGLTPVQWGNDQDRFIQELAA